jgi:hypothetical protein
MRFPKCVYLRTGEQKQQLLQRCLGWWKCYLGFGQCAAQHLLLEVLPPGLHLTRKCASYLVAENGGGSKKPHNSTIHIADSKHSISFLPILMMPKYLTGNIPKSVRRTSSRIKASKGFVTATKIWMLPVKCRSRSQSRWRLWQATCNGHHTGIGKN